MIISASRRTDLPCYYVEWFMNRIRAGSVQTRNPHNHAQVRQVSLAPEQVDCFVFWTKDAQNLMPHLDELDRRGYAYYFQFTLTPYDRSVEPGLRDKEAIHRTFAELSHRLGRNRVLWRYDPILFGPAYTTAYHREQFTRSCERLAPLTDTVIISFYDLYSKLKDRPFRAPGPTEVRELAGLIGRTAQDCGLTALACCEQTDLTPFGIKPSACIDKARIEQISGRTLKVIQDKNQRPGCFCVASVDIGSYNTCLSGCRYCYANYAPATTRRKAAAHDPNGELLIGDLIKSSG
jgi:hypothetical protein